MQYEGQLNPEKKTSVPKYCYGCLVALENKIQSPIPNRLEFELIRVHRVFIKI